MEMALYVVVHLMKSRCSVFKIFILLENNKHYHMGTSMNAVCCTVEIYIGRSLSFILKEKSYRIYEYME